MGRKIDRMTEEDFREMNDLKKENRGMDADLPEMSSESNWYINDIQAQQIIDTPPTPIKEVNVFNDSTLPKKDRVTNAKKILDGFLNTNNLGVKEIKEHIGVSGYGEVVYKNLRDKFIDHGIPYDDIDPEMVDLLDVLNFHLGLTTKFCCYGHDDKTKTYVVFDEKVSDENIYTLAEQSGKSYMQINFNKWVRHYPVRANWTLELGVMFKDPNDALKKKHLDNVVECLRDCKAVTNEI